MIDNHSDGAYAVLRFTAACPHSPEDLQVTYRLFSDIDPQHKDSFAWRQEARRWMSVQKGG